LMYSMGADRFSVMEAEAGRIFAYDYAKEFENITGGSSLY